MSQDIPPVEKPVHELANRQAWDAIGKALGEIANVGKVETVFAAVVFLAGLFLGPLAMVLFANVVVLTWLFGLTLLPTLMQTPTEPNARRFLLGASGCNAATVGLLVFFVDFPQSCIILTESKLQQVIAAFTYMLTGSSVLASAIFAVLYLQAISRYFASLELVHSCKRFVLILGGWYAVALAVVVWLQNAVAIWMFAYSSFWVGFKFFTLAGKTRDVIRKHTAEF